MRYQVDLIVMISFGHTILTKQAGILNVGESPVHDQKHTLEFTKMVRKRRLMERLSQALNGRFPGFALNSQKSSNLHAKGSNIWESSASSE